MTNTLQEAIFNISENSKLELKVYLGKNNIKSYKYSQLYKESVKFSANLRAKGVKEKDEVIVALDREKDFIVTFFSLLLIGAIPIPIYLKEHLDKRLNKKLSAITKATNSEKIILNKKTSIALNKIQKESNLDQIIFEHTIISEAFTSFTDFPLIKKSDIAFIICTNNTTEYISHEYVISNVEKFTSNHNICNCNILCSTPIERPLGLSTFLIGSILTNSELSVLPYELLQRRPLKLLMLISKLRPSVTSLSGNDILKILSLTNNKKISKINLSSLSKLFIDYPLPTSYGINLFLQQLQPLGLLSKSIHLVHKKKHELVFNVVKNNFDMKRDNKNNDETSMESDTIHINKKHALFFPIREILATFSDLIIHRTAIVIDKKTTSSELDKKIIIICERKELIHKDIAEIKYEIQSIVEKKLNFKISKILLLRKNTLPSDIFGNVNEKKVSELWKKNKLIKNPIKAKVKKSLFSAYNSITSLATKKRNHFDDESIGYDRVI